MGSGCIPGSGLSSAMLKPTPDSSVIYTGAAIPELNICTGDTLSEIEGVILSKILDFAKGHSITITEIDLTKCDCFKTKVGCCGASSCQTLVCILQAYLDCLCELYADVQDLKVKVSAMYDGPYTVACLTANSGGVVTSSSKLPVIMQELIKEFCALYAQVQVLQTTLNNFLATGLGIAIGNFMNTALKSCQTDGLVKSGPGASFTATFSGFAPKGSILMYGGPLSVFDSTGKGYNPGPACGWQLCNGGAGSVDMRGYVPVGVNDGTMGGGSQDNRVNNAINPGQSYAYNSINGQIKTTISSGNIPGMSFSGATSGTTASFAFWSGARGTVHTTTSPSLMQWNDTWSDAGPGSSPDKSMTVSIPGQTFSGSVGGGGSSPAGIDIRQPSTAVYFIQRMS